MDPKRALNWSQSDCKTSVWLAIIGLPPHQRNSTLPHRLLNASMSPLYLTLAAMCIVAALVFVGGQMINASSMD